MQRYGQVVKVRPEKYEEYKYLHDNIWPEIVDLIHGANVENFSIFYRDGYLFKYFEYVGDDFEADMAKLAANPKNKEWLTHTDPCQEGVETAEPGQLWVPMDLMIHF